VYVRSVAVWSEQAKLVASDGAASDAFATSVAISGDTVVVGAPDHTTDMKGLAGQAYVYVRSGTTWSEQAKLKASDGALGDSFGDSVAISGEAVVVGARSVTPEGVCVCAERDDVERAGQADSQRRRVR